MKDGREKSADARILAAIDARKLVALVYDNRPRVVELHDYGIRQGIETLLAYQVRGLSRSGRVPGWRDLELSKTSQLVVLDETFPGSRGGQHRAHKVWDILFARVR